MAEMGLRERKKHRVRQQILDVCERLFRAHGFDETTVNEIAEQAEISRPTFFNYFKNKESVLAELGLLWLQKQAEGVPPGATADSSSGDTMRRVLREQLAAIEKDRDFMRLVFTRSGLLFPHGPHVGSRADTARLDRTRRLFSAISSLVAAGQKAGRVRRDVPPDQIAEMYVAVLSITARLWLTDYWGDTGSLVDRGLRAFDILSDGLRPPEDG